MEKTMKESHTAVKSFTLFRIEDVVIASFALVVGIVEQPYAIAFVLSYLSYIYIRRKKESKIAVVFMVLASLVHGFEAAYSYMLVIAIYFICIQVCVLLEKSVVRCLPWICVGCAAPYLLIMSRDYRLICAILLFLLLHMVFIQDNIHWINKRFILHKSMYTMLLLAMAFCIKTFLPVNGVNWIVLVFMVLSALIGEGKDVALNEAILFIIFPDIYALVWGLLIIAISFYKEHKLMQLLLCAGVLLFLPYQVEYVIMAGIIALLCLLYNDRYVPFLERVQEKQPVYDSVRQDLSRKLSNFSSIFASLSQYYTSVSNIEADMLSNMSQALAFSNDELKKHASYEDQKERILKALDGYQYEVDDFLFERSDDEVIHMELDIRNIKRMEISSTLIPLLEILMKCRFEVEEIKARRFTKVHHHISLHSAPAFTIDAYADSRKNIYEKSGDCFSIFRFRQSVVCMISDGMGSGENAARSSRLITNIFQRMISSGIAQDAAIRCINKLLQSDAYATLDVISFDRMRGLAYIAKSAACPTFLIRDKEVYEISGSSLPVGIVSTIEPDCFTIKVEAGDTYLMVSDGIYMDEIYTWMKQRKGNGSKEQIEEMMEIIKQSPRKDDSTVLLANIEAC